MGRLTGCMIGILMFFMVAVIESFGHRMEIFNSGPTPELVGLITFTALFVSSIALKANRFALLTVEIIIGFAFADKLYFFRRSIPKSLCSQ